MTEKQLDFALDLMRRLPPTQVANNLTGLLNTVPELTEDLLQSVDRPFKIEYDAETDKDFLLCDYNRDENSYRYRFVFRLLSSFHSHLDRLGPTSTFLRTTARNRQQTCASWRFSSTTQSISTENCMTQEIIVVRDYFS
jgi:hypothetical protein